MAEQAPYRGLLDEATDAAQADRTVVGLLLTGSLARGDAAPGADVDLRYVLVEGGPRRFVSEDREGVRVERHFQDEAGAREAIAANPMQVYSHLDGRVLHDPQGALARLREVAQSRFATYRTPAAERERVRWWLRTAQEKVTTAAAAGDDLKAGFVTATSSWQLIEGLWAVNDRPLPPNSSVRPHLPDLTGPPDLVERYAQLFLGDAAARVAAWNGLVAWILSRLERPQSA